MVSDLVLALSLSNLCFINAWRLLLIPSSFQLYHRKFSPPVADYLGLVLDVLFFALAIFLAITIARRAKNSFLMKSSRVLFLLVLCIPLYGLAMQIDNPAVQKLTLTLLHDQSVAPRLIASIPLTICIFFLVVALLRTQIAIRFGVTALLILSPFVPVTFSQAAWQAIRNRNLNANKGSVALLRVNGQPRPRVLWLIFDELDFRLAFSQRPSTLKLPELDRLARESLFAENAYPPAGETFVSMPALITGRLISEARRSGTDELMIKFGDETQEVPWSAQPNIFTRAHSAGFNTALFGWYHPYCRILGSTLNLCGWEDGIVSTKGDGLSPYMYDHARKGALSIPLAVFLYSAIDRSRIDPGEQIRTKHISDFNFIYRNALTASTNPDLGLVMIHWPIPHHPNIYSRSQLRTSTSKGRSYIDNLALVDRTVGDIRRAMESSGTWSSTAVLISSDHWWRADSVWRKRVEWTAEDEASFAGQIDRRVPFILKLFGSEEDGVRLTGSFNTVLTHDLLLAILRGEVSHNNDAAAWIERNRTIGRSPYDDRMWREESQ